MEQVQRDLARLERQIERLSEMQVSLKAAHIQTETRIANMIESCPHREAIARASNNLTRLAALEGKLEAFNESNAKRHEALSTNLRDLERAFDRSGIINGATGGGVVTLVGALMVGIGRMLGWW